MEITEKLNIFYSSAIEVANKQSSDELREYTHTIERAFAEFKANKEAEIQARFQVEESKQKRDSNRQVSGALVEEKRKLNLHQQAKKEALFAAVQKKIDAFRQGAEYPGYLEAKIKMARDYARQEEVVIYLDPQDEQLKASLEQKTGCTLTLSQMSFGGGIRAVIRSRNVLIDESFDSRLGQERDAHTF